MGMFITGKVLRNIHDFERVTKKEPLSEDLPQKEQDEGVYHAILNKKTGDIRFLGYFKELEEAYDRLKEEGFDEEDWKAIRLTVDEREEEKKKSFSMKDDDDEDLKDEDLEPLAKRVAHETLQLLNQKGEEAKGKERKGRLEHVVLEDISNLHPEVQREPIQEDEAWMGFITRTEAEKLLENKPRGTYLIRKGGATTIAIEQKLSEEGKTTIHCYVVTLIEEKETFTDFMIFHRGKRWVLYHDIPELQLSEEGYPSLSELLVDLKEKAKYPFSFNPL